MKTIAIVNEKGGTGKTTTAVNLAAALGEAGKKVLLVDLDGQAASSRWLGVEEDSRLADALLNGGGLEPLENVIPGVSLAPASGKLDSVSHNLRPTQGGQLRKVLAEVGDGYDYILIDCPPSLGNRLIGNGLLAATHAIVPVEMSILALDGLRILLTTLDDIRDGFDHKIELIGILACRYEPRTRLSRLVLSELRKALGDKVFKTVIRETVRMQECPASGESILDYAAQSNAAADYRALAKEMVAGMQKLPAADVAEGDLAAEPDLTESERLAVVDFRKQAYEGLIRGSQKSDGSGKGKAVVADEVADETDAQPACAIADETAPAAPGPSADSAPPLDSPQQEEEWSSPAPQAEPEPVEAMLQTIGGEEQAGDETDLMHVTETADTEEQEFACEEAPSAEEAPFTADDFTGTRFDDWRETVHLDESHRRNGKKRAVLVSTAVAAVIVASVLTVRWGLNQAGMRPGFASADETAMQIEPAAPAGEASCEAQPIDAGTGEEAPAAPADVQDAPESSQDSSHASPTATDQSDPTAGALEPATAPEPDAGTVADTVTPAPAPADDADRSESTPRYRTPPPGFSVSGIMSSSTGAGAIVNGQWVQVGHTVDGAKVVGIVPAAVELELDGERFRLVLGEDTAKIPEPGQSQPGSAEKSIGDSDESTGVR